MAKWTPEEIEIIKNRGTKTIKELCEELNRPAGQVKNKIHVLGARKNKKRPTPDDFNQKPQKKEKKGMEPSEILDYIKDVNKALDRVSKEDRVIILEFLIELYGQES